jgi:hypothetical protein
MIDDPSGGIDALLRNVKMDTDEDMLLLQWVGEAKHV